MKQLYQSDSLLHHPSSQGNTGWELLCTFLSMTMLESAKENEQRGIVIEHVCDYNSDISYLGSLDGRKQKGLILFLAALPKVPRQINPRS